MPNTHSLDTRYAFKPTAQPLPLLQGPATYDATTYDVRSATDDDARPVTNDEGPATDDNARPPTLCTIYSAFTWATIFATKLSLNKIKYTKLSIVFSHSRS